MDIKDIRPKREIYTVDDKDEPAGWVGDYKPPVTIYMQQAYSNYVEKIENGITSQINTQIGVDVDKAELERALAYDRDQYHTGWHAGYWNGKNSGYDEGYKEGWQEACIALQAAVQSLKSMKLEHDAPDDEEASNLHD